MARTEISRRSGRKLFGLDPASYDASRPNYPDWVVDALRERAGLGQHSAVLEIGAGTGTATRQILALRPRKVTAIEPDARLAGFLRSKINDAALTVYQSAFEDASLAEGDYDLAFSATAFHWLEEALALAKIARLLRPGGWWAAVWNVFGDRDREDPFHEATKLLLEGPTSPSDGEGQVPYALDVTARTAALEASGAFDSIIHLTSSWSLTIDAEQVIALYGSYSNINIRPDREIVLQELDRIARDQFDDRVTRNMITSLYLARRT